MRCSRFEATVFLGVGVFLVGVICLAFVAVNTVFPAREEQNLKEINCKVTNSEINGNGKCSSGKQGDASYPCLKIYVVCGEDAKRNDSTENTQPLMLYKNVHSLHQQCSYQPEECLTKIEENSKHVKAYESQNGQPSTLLQCFYSPEKPREVVREKASTESYNKLVLQSAIWPLAIILLAIVVIGTAACFCPRGRRADYEQLVGVSDTSLQRTL